ncbi:MAG TPA: DEAD/DEAH box helicase family protein [Pirellulaceae bacterium]|nr:DEAD/DEAH box helicase family protein [Pirellulaceae bacterium]
MRAVTLTDAVAFPPLRFRGQLRPSQTEVVAIAQKKLAEGARRLHIVAPPGSGKTVLGLYLWAACIRRPALVLSPNSAIQAQWAAKCELFDGTGNCVISTDVQSPGLLTSLTYQAITIPGRGDDDLDAAACGLWREKLIEKGQAKDPEEAEIWLADLLRHNAGYYEQRLASYRKQLRDARAIGGEALATLHASALASLERLKAQRIGLIILDECHHLLGHWGRVLADAHDLLEEPVIVGLTATPPDRDGKLPADVLRYDEFLGPVDYEVPVPAVVKDGFLAPYQDLAYFVRPRPEELSFIANADDELHTIVRELCDAGAFAERDSFRSEFEGISLPQREAEGDSGTGMNFVLRRESLPQWLLRVLAEKRLPTGVAKDWASFERRDPEFALAARRFLTQRRFSLPEDVPPVEEEPETEEAPEMEFLAPVLDRYVRHRLRRSADERDHALAEKTIARLRILGIQITETGWQACASPVGRVMAYSRSKAEALAPILAAEHKLLGDRLRAVVVADYEKSSAVAASVAGLLDEEAGGAIAAFKTLIRRSETDCLNPVLVTGSSVLVDDDLQTPFLEAAKKWLADEGYEVELSMTEEAGFHVVVGRGGDWCPRVYVELITELFQRGITRCLVGTRGLLGEGWDATKINVLIDMTTVTTSMTVNQLRGRSIRLDADDPRKLANNWDVVCIAPEFSKGLDDYYRFRAKHETLYGVTDDGAIEKGVGHVHPAFTRLKPEGLEGNVAAIDEEMLARAARRDEVRALWKIGQPYQGLPIRALEYKPRSEPTGREFPPFKGSRSPWSSRSLALAIGEAVLGALIEAKLLQRGPAVHAADRAGGYVRLFLENAPEEESQLFTQSLHEALGPLHSPRYVIPRLIDRLDETWLSSLLPQIVGQFFRTRTRKQAMLHAVPSALARNRDLVAIYEQHWNRHVSAGEAIFTLRGSADELLEKARKRSELSSAWVHEKEVFL